MILNRYEIFLKTAEIGNITKTAEILHYTQAGISHAIAALEKETGFSLLARSASGVTITENGKRLLPYIQTLVNDQHGLSQAIYDINETVAGTLRIATFTSVSTQWLPTIIRKFQADYPLVEFDLLAGDYDEITERILSGRVDCGFLTAPVADPLVFHLLYKDPMNVLLPERHPLTRQDVLTLPEIKKEPLVLPTKGSDNDIQAVLNSTRGKTNVRYVLNDDLSVISMVSHGFGITIMPELILRNLNYSLEIRPIDPPQYRAIGIASMPLNRVSVLTKTFIQYLTDPSKIDFNELCS